MKKKSNRQVEIETRVLNVSDYVIATNATVRTTAKVFGVSKTTIHKDISERLPKLEPKRAEYVKAILGHNKLMRAMRGGIATKERWIQMMNEEKAI